MSSDQELDQIAEEVLKDTEAEAKGQETPEGDKKPEAKVEEGDEEFLSRAEKEKIKHVPYERFSKVYKTQKELKKWRADAEARLKDFDAWKKDVNTLSTRAQKNEFLRDLITELVSPTPDDKINWGKYHEAIGKLLQTAPSGKSGQDSERQPQVNQEIENLKHEMLSRDYTAHFKDGFARISKVVKKEFPAVEVNQQFLEEVERMIPAEIARLESEGKRPFPDMVALARLNAKRYQDFANRLLKEQAGGRRTAEAAALTRSAGRPSGSIQNQAPDINKDPEGYQKWLFKEADDLERELGLSR